MSAYFWPELALLFGAGLIGVATGYLCLRYGLDAAMLAHFSADLVLHGIGACGSAGMSAAAFERSATRSPIIGVGAVPGMYRVGSGQCQSLQQQQAKG